MLNFKGSRFDSPEQIVKQKPKQKNFEELFIIGAEKEDLKSLDWSKSRQHLVGPKTLYMHNNQKGKEDERRRVVKDFCFPDGIAVKLIKKKGEALTEKNSQML